MIQKWELRRRIEEAGFANDDEFSDAIGYSRVHANNVINGHSKPSTDMLTSMAKVLGCTIDDIWSVHPKVAALVSEPNYGAVGAVA